MNMYGLGSGNMYVSTSLFIPTRLNLCHQGLLYSDEAGIDREHILYRGKRPQPGRYEGIRGSRDPVRTSFAMSRRSLSLSLVRSRIFRVTGSHFTVHPLVFFPVLMVSPYRPNNMRMVDTFGKGHVFVTGGRRALFEPDCAGSRRLCLRSVWGRGRTDPGCHRSS